LKVIEAGRLTEPEIREEEIEFLVRLLVEYGADVNLHGPLHAAVAEKEISVVRFLLSRGAKLDALLDGETVLMASLKSRSSFYSERVVPIIKILLAHGADRNSNEAQILTAATYQCPKSVECILEHFYGKFDPEISPVAEPLELWDQIKDEDTKPVVVDESHTSLPIKQDIALLSMNEMKDSLSNITRSTDLIPKVRQTCCYCSRFEKEAVERKWLPHSPDQLTLQQAIIDGCQMCKLIKDCLPDTFGPVSLYYYSTESISGSRNYYERILVRCKVPNNFIYGELRLAAIEGM
jgi:hypothetical protein